MPKLRTRIGSTSIMTLAIKNVGKSRKPRNKSPISNPGPKWNGVKGIILESEIELKILAPQCM